MDRRHKVLAMLRTPGPVLEWRRLSFRPLRRVLGSLIALTVAMYFVGSIYQGTIGDFYST